MRCVMCRRYKMGLMLLSLLCVYPAFARVSEAARGGPLVCHKGGKTECAVPAACQVRASDRCVHGECPPLVDAPDGTVCDDGNPETSGDSCTQGVCGGLPICPDDGNPCTTEVGHADGTCTSVNVADGTPCSDVDSCTTGTSCQAGVCGGG